jgi:hypothetical protein
VASIDGGQAGTQASAGRGDRLACFGCCSLADSGSPGTVLMPAFGGLCDHWSVCVYM